MVFSRQYALLVLVALVSTQVLSQEFKPSCAQTDVFFVKLSTYNGNTNSYLADTAYYYGSYPDVQFSLYGTTSDQFAVRSPNQMNNAIWGSGVNFDWVASNFDEFHAEINDEESQNYRSGSRKVVIFGFGNNVYAFDESMSAIITAVRRFRETPFADGTFAEVFAYADISNPDPVTRDFLYDFVSDPHKEHICYACGSENLFYKVAQVTGQTCISIGDPYIYTFDGTGYNFNGLGEYWFFRNEDLRVQVRMTTCDSNQNPTSRTCNRAVVISFGDTDNAPIAFYYDPITELLLVEQYGSFIKGDNIYVNNGGYELYGSVHKIDTAIDSDSIYAASLFAGNGNLGSYRILLLFGKNTGAGISLTTPIGSFGSTLGLCGTFDSCSSNDLYSANQTYTSPSGRAEDIYFDFAETWKVGPSDTLFSHGPNGAKYMPNYAEYPPAWAPAFGAPQPSAGAVSACAFLKDSSNFLYQACLDDYTKGGLDIRPIALLLAETSCQIYCEYGISESSVVSTSYCDSICPSDNDIDFHETYDQFNVPFDLESYNWGARFSATLGGTYQVALKSSFCPSLSAVSTIRITCDQRPKVNAGQDRTVTKRNAYGFPAVVLQGSVTDTNPDVLEYSWRFISWPTPNDTAVLEDFNPITGTVSPPDLDLEQSLITAFQPEYPGVYELELAAFDGCLIGKDTVKITVTCADCDLNLVAETPEDVIFTYWDYYSFSESYGTYLDYQFEDDSNFELAWFIDSNPRNLAHELTFSGGYKEFTFFEQTFEEYNSTVIDPPVVDSTSQDSDLYTDSVNTNRFIRNEGVKESLVVLNTTTILEVITDFYNSIPSRTDICRIYLNDGSTEYTEIWVDDYVQSYNDLMGTDFGCLGDYTLRFAARDSCKKSSHLSNLRVRCGASPDAHFRVCSKTLKYDYDTTSWPTITLDASDSFDVDTNNLVYRYEVVSQPSGSSQPSYLPLVGHSCSSSSSPDVYENCQYNDWTPTAPGQYQLGVRVSDGCTQDFDTVTITTQCEPLSLAITANAAYNSASTDPGYNEADVSAAATSENPVGTIGWDIVSPASAADRPATLSDLSGDTTTITFHRPGTYTLLSSVSDGCQTVSASRSITYTCSHPLAASLTGAPSPVIYDTDTRTFPSFVATGTTTAELSQSRTFYTYKVTSAPVGSSLLDYEESATLVSGDPDTFEIIPDIAGSYTVTFFVDDNCRTASASTTFSAGCVNFAAPTVAIDTPTPFTWDGPVHDLQIDLTATPNNANHDLSWELTRPNGDIENLGAGTTAFFMVNSVGTHTVRVYETDGCRTVSASVNVPVTCNHTFTLGAITGASVAWSNGKFARVQFKPTFVGDRYTAEEREAELTNYEWHFASAPVNSVFYAPPTYTEVLSTVVDTFPGGFIPSGLPDGQPQWKKVTEIYTTTETRTTSTRVSLTYDDTVGDHYAGCFNPDVAGSYQLTFTILDYCLVPKTVSATVTATCNTAPTANAGAAQTINSQAIFSPVTLNGVAADADNDVLETMWTITSAPEDSFPSLINVESTKATFYPDVAGVYTFQFSVSDGCSTTTSTTTVTVACAAPYSVTSYNFRSDGYTPIAVQSFPIKASPQCNYDLYWELISYDPSTGEGPNPPPPTSTGGGEEGSAAGHLTVPAFFVALMTLLVKLF